MAISNLSNGLRTGVCTSTNRPTTPYEGQVIYETDTDLVYLWNGTAWVEIVSALTKAPRGICALTSSTTSDNTITAEEVQITGSSFTAVANRYYKITYFEPDPASVTATSFFFLRIRLTNGSGTILNTAYSQLPTSGITNASMTCLYVGTLTAGSTNAVATMASNTGTASAGRSASQNAYLLVEDIGAV